MKPTQPIPDEKNKRAFQILEKALSKYKGEEHLLIGITGAGGAGKTTFANNIVSYFGSEQALTIDLDDYLISREKRGKLEITGYNPQANNLSLAREHVEALLIGKNISKPRYDHSTGKILNDKQITAKPLIIVEGVTTLYDELKELHHTSFFLDAQEETQIKSRIQRDVNKRGYTLEEALSLFEAVKPDYERFIAPTKQYAAIVFSVTPDYVMHPIHINEELQ
ncbi:hypothetical protein GF367_01015 [Candidatus Woesearchaeota archaeon]|nr:hypothetical protein [Candidatus Woesearchaeota archaeon]